MDWLDRITGILVVVLVIAALCFPINRDDDRGD
jgi:succinate dehydrogenase hydrophobic anchor subunit